jgi:hypothetical protein
MKRKMDLLAAALAGQSDGLQTEAEAIPEGDNKCPQDAPTLGRK